jgi:hypothetical protein
VGLHSRPHAVPDETVPVELTPRQLALLERTVAEQIRPGLRGTPQQVELEGLRDLLRRAQGTCSPVGI